jgi:hypothetical protein
MGTSKLGNMLVEDGLLSESDRRTIKRTCGTGGSAFARGILAMGLLDEDELAAYIAEHTSWKVAAKNLIDSVQSGAWGCVDRPLVEQLEVLPVRLAGDTLHVAMIDPLDQDTISQLEFFSGYKILPLIATMTQVRSGLLKFLPDYQATHSQLEDFLKNHSLTASKRVRMADESLYDELPSPESFSVQGFTDPAVKHSPSARPVAKAVNSAKNDDIADEVEFSTNDDPVDPEDSEAGSISVEDSDEALELSMNEESTNDEDDLFSIEEESSSETGDKSKNSDQIELDGFDNGEDDSVFDDPLLEPDVDLKAAPSNKKMPPPGDDLEDLMDLSDFDPEKTISDDDLNLDFDDSPVSTKKQTAPVVDIDSPLELSDNLDGIAESDLADDLNADFSDSGDSGAGSADDLFAESDNLMLDDNDNEVFKSTSKKNVVNDRGSSIAAESTFDTDLDEELSADFSSMTVESSGDLDLDTDTMTAAQDSTEFLSADESEFSFDSDEDTPSFSSDSSAQETKGLPDDSKLELISSDDSESLFDESNASSFESEAAATEDVLDDSQTKKVGKTLAETPQNLSMNINRMFFQVSMATETKTAIGAIASDLKASGFSTGMVIGGTANSQFRPECGWLDSQTGNQQSTTAAALQDKGIAAALGRLQSAWTPLDDAVRSGDLKVFASLQRDNKKLYGIKFSDGKAKKDTVVVTTMATEISENEGLMQMAADLFKQIAAKNKGAA